MTWAQSAQHGDIRICRTPGVVSITDHKPISLPAGTEFVTSPDFMDSQGKLKIIHVKTSAAATISAAAKCSVVEAELVENETGNPVTKKAHRLSWSGSGDYPEVVAYIASDFK